MIKRLLPALLIGAALTLNFASPALASGPNGNDYDENHNWPAPQFQARVESRPDGVYIQISARQTIPGAHQSAPSAPATARPTSALSPAQAVRQTSSPAAPSTPAPAPGRTWSDDTGIYHQTPDGHLYYLTIPNISNAIDWKSQFAEHPKQTPYLLYVDNHFQGLIWVPNDTSNQDLHFSPPPAQPAVPGNPPAGNGSSTDPYQVALDLLAHVSLPNFQLKMNPALGLVNLPGWFWVDGYDGKPFGTSRTVTIPPAVGPEVPVTQVPRDDPRRQSTSFTVSVTVSASSYQWSFGDGASLASQSLGQAYPARSDIQHTYTFSSLQFPNGFPVDLTVVYSASYQVNGGASQGLPPISHTYTAAYPVQEAQAVLIRH